MNKSEINEAIKKILKEHLKVEVVTESTGSECSYYENTYVKLIFMDEVISTSEIQKLSENC